MPNIQVTDETFALLQRIAKPLVDTADSALHRVLSEYLSQPPIAPAAQSPSIIGSATPSVASPNSVRAFDPNSPPSLTHTSFVRGDVAGAPVSNWNNLVDEVHAKAFALLGNDFRELRKNSEANLQSGERSDSGFRTVRDLGFSIQGVDAKKAWAISLGIAKKLEIPIQAEFRWQSKETAAHPGEVGRLVWKPNG